jgi:hypothetical protein
MTGRAQTILRRLPAHFEATRAGKQFEVVAEAGAVDFDSLAVALGRVRRAHRIGEAEELLDILRLAALHGITRSELALADIRFATARDFAEQLAETASPPSDLDALAEALIALWGIAEPAPRLGKYAQVNSPPADSTAARRRLLAHVVATLTRERLNDVIRSRILRISGIHARGNGTVRTILEGAANCLDLQIDSIAHSADRYLHIAAVRDRITLTRPVPVPGSPPTEASAPFAPAAESLIVEENPLWRFETGTVERHHAELFSVARKGFERAILQVRITGLETKTVGPMFVNRDEGHGVGFTQTVPPGSTLVFVEEGRAWLGSSDVTSQAYAWKGACFAGDDDRPTDWVFDGPGVDPERRAVFVEAFPPGALDSDFVFPHAGDSIPMPGIALGETRFAVFMQQAHYSHLDSGSPPRMDLVTPRTKVGFLDGSVFAAGSGEAPPPAALVSLSWLERRAYSALVWIPMRFQKFIPADAEGLEVKRRVVQALDRFRPAGVQLEVEYLDPRWVMGRGVAHDEDSDEPTGPGSGTVLWSAPEDA